MENGSVSPSNRLRWQTTNPLFPSTKIYKTRSLWFDSITKKQRHRIFPDTMTEKSSARKKMQLLTHLWPLLMPICFLAITTWPICIFYFIFPHLNILTIVLVFGVSLVSRLVHFSSITSLSLFKAPMMIYQWHHTKRGSAWYIVREVCVCVCVWERERERERERETEVTSWQLRWNWRRVHTFPCQKFTLFVTSFPNGHNCGSCPTTRSLCFSSLKWSAMCTDIGNELTLSVAKKFALFVHLSQIARQVISSEPKTNDQMCGCTVLLPIKKKESKTVGIDS